MTRPLSPALALVLVVIAVSTAVGLDLADPSQATTRPEPEPAGPAVAGAWYCAAGATSDQSTVHVTAAVPPGGSAPSEIEFGLQVGGAVTELSSERIFPSAARAIDIAPGRDAFAISARWWDRPAVVARTWSVEGPGLPTSLVSGPCVPGPSTTWYLPGMSTAGGASARLYLANPFDTDASVAIRFTGPTGGIEPILLENVVVAAHDVTVVDLNEHIPRQADFGVVVEARSGRVVAEGAQLVSPAIGGIAGGTLVSATPRLATTWTVPWSVTDPVGDEVPADAESGPGGTASWVWISNPGDDAASVSLTLHGVNGPAVADIGDEIAIGPRSVVRVDLRGLLPPGESVAGATVRSENDVPVAVSVGSVLRDGGSADRSGFTAQLGAPDADSAWVVPGEFTGGRDQVLHLVNPGAEPAVVDIALWVGASVLRPDELRDLTVGPGALVEVSLTAFLPEAADHTAFVTASQGTVVAGRRGMSREGPARWVVHTGVPGALWRGGDAVPVVVHDPYLVERLDTSLGLPTDQPEPVVPTEVGTEPSPTFSPPGPIVTPDLDG
jgi:hypothetical protein